MYIINDYQITSIKSESYIYNDTKAAKITNQVLNQIFAELHQQDKCQISEEHLSLLAQKHQINLKQLKKILINQLDVLRPLLAKQFTAIYVNADDDFVADLLMKSLNDRYEVCVVHQDFVEYTSGSLVIFYRSNYSSRDFQPMYRNLVDDVYVITAGIIHKTLVIDNLYFNHSGLPSHIANLHQLMAVPHSDPSSTQDNWLVFYRSMVNNKVDEFPEPKINACQKGFVAYSLYQFVSQYTDFWRIPMPLDQVNWFWRVDLKTFSVHKEVAEGVITCYQPQSAHSRLIISL